MPSEQRQRDGSCLSGSFDEQAQFDFGLRVITKIGYDLERGRLDRTHHPFCAKFSLGDVRITTRVYKNDVVRCVLRNGARGKRDLRTGYQFSPGGHAAWKGCE